MRKWMALLLVVVAMGWAQQEKKGPSPQTARSGGTVQGKLVPLNVQTGLWEMTNTANTSGQLPLTDEQLARLTPQQRARLEEGMRQQNAQPHTSNYQSCWTKEKLEDGGGLMGKDCDTKILSSDGSKTALQATCNMQGMQTNFSGEMDAVDRTHVSGHGVMVMSAGARTMRSNVTISGKWVSANCGSVQ